MCGAGRRAPLAPGSGREAAVRKASRPAGRPNPLLLRPGAFSGRSSNPFFPPPRSPGGPSDFPACLCGTTPSPLFTRAPAASNHLHRQASACGTLRVHPSTRRCRPPRLPRIWPNGAGTRLCPRKTWGQRHPTPHDLHKFSQGAKEEHKEEGFPVMRNQPGARPRNGKFPHARTGPLRRVVRRVVVPLPWLFWPTCNALLMLTGNSPRHPKRMLKEQPQIAPNTRQQRRATPMLKTYR